MHLLPTPPGSVHTSFQKVLSTLSYLADSCSLFQTQTCPSVELFMPHISSQDPSQWLSPTSAALEAVTSDPCGAMSPFCLPGSSVSHNYCC